MRVRLKPEALARALKSKPISQNAWARRLGITGSHLSMLLSGKRKFPGLELRRRLLQVLELEFEDLFELEDEPPSNLRHRLLLDYRAGGFRIRIDRPFQSNRKGDSKLPEIVQDIRFGIRTLRRDLRFTTAALITLTLAIGANTALFSVLSGVLFYSHPFPESERIVTLWEGEGDNRFVASPPNYRDWKTKTDSFSAMAAFQVGSANLSGQGQPVRVKALMARSSILSVLAVQPVLGRGFTDGEDEPGNDGVLLISQSLFSRYFDGASDLEQLELEVDGRRRKVIGVMPANFEFLTIERGEPFVIVPQTLSPRQLSDSQRGAHWISVVARLKEGVSIEEADAELSALQARLVANFPDRLGDHYSGATIVPLDDFLTESVQQPLLLLFGAVVLVLLVACTNVANLILARSARREGEFGVRAALGAGKGMLSRQLVLENLILTLAAGLLGLLLAFWLLRVFVRLGPSQIPRLTHLTLDIPVLLFTLGICLFTGLVFGLLPLHRLYRGDLSRTLTTGRSRLVGVGARGRGLMVAVQVSVALTLLIGAGLLLRTLYALENVNPGFAAESQFVFSLETQELGEDSNARTARRLEELIGELEALPGVETVGAAMTLPLANGWDVGGTFTILGREDTDPEPSARLTPVTPGYFDAMGIRLLTGRIFDQKDRLDSPGVFLVNRTAARRFWGDESPLGKRIRTHVGMAERGREGEIVGVVADVRRDSLNADPVAEIYQPHTQQPINHMTVVLRSSLSPSHLEPRIREMVERIIPGVPIYDAKTLRDVRDNWMEPVRFRSFLLGTFSLAALLLASVGLYSVTYYLVSNRTAEIGVRMALGAARSEIIKMVLVSGLKWILLGLAAGLMGAYFLSRTLAGMLYGVEPVDPLSYTALALLMLAFGLAACLLPARRASRIDPLQALRTG